MEICEYLENRGIKPTVNRVLVMKAITKYNDTFTLRDIEDKIDTLDKSSVFRVLRLFSENHIVHEIDDGTGSVKYELCRSKREDKCNDSHVHFYCKNCHRTLCMHNIPTPDINLPYGFISSNINYVIKGVCASCNSKK